MSFSLMFYPCVIWVSDDRELLEKKYLLASEISERVNIHAFVDTVKMLNAIPDSLDAFYTKVTDSMATLLGNIDKALVIFIDFIASVSIIAY